MRLLSAESGMFVEGMGRLGVPGPLGQKVLCGSAGGLRSRLWVRFEGVGVRRGERIKKGFLRAQGRVKGEMGEVGVEGCEAKGKWTGEGWNCRELVEELVRGKEWEKGLGVEFLGGEAPGEAIFDSQMVLEIMTRGFVGRVAGLAMQ